MSLIGFEGDSIYIVVDANTKKLQSCNIIFMEGTANRYNKNGPPQWSTCWIQNLMRPKRNVPGQKCGELTLHANLSISQTKESVTKFSSGKSQTMHPTSKHPKAYSDTINSPKGKLCKDTMDYKLDKLEEMKTWP